MIAAGLYVCIAALTIWATSNGRNHASIWAADAVILGALLDLPMDRWLQLLGVGLVANHLANDLMRGFSAAHILYGMVNMGQVWLIATMLRRPSEIGSLLADATTLWRFVLWAGLLGPALGGVFGSLTSSWFYGQSFWESYLRWFASNSLGLLIATPFFKAIFDNSLRDYWISKSTIQRISTVSLLIVFSIIVALTFLQNSLPLLFLPVSGLVLLAFNMGRIGVKAAVILAAIIGTWATLEGYGPVASMTESVFAKSVFYQFYLVVLMGTGLLVVSVVASRSEFMMQLRDREEFLRNVLAHSPDVVLSLDRGGKCTFAGGPSEILLGVPHDAILGQTLSQLATGIAIDVAWLDPTSFDDHDPPHAVDFEPHHAPELTIEAVIAPMWTENRRTGYVVTFRNITARKNIEEDLRKKAYLDDMTRTLNRLGFLREVDAALDDGGDASLALIDIDFFKSINDTFGHTSGDDALIVVSHTIKSLIRPGDAVGRLGGDEFAILFRDNASTALKKCEMIVAEVKNSKVHSRNGSQIHLSISCGVVGIRPGWAHKDIFDAADAALYKVKQRGRDGVLLAS